MVDRRGACSPRRDRLKSATAKVHEAIDRSINEAGFLRTRSGYEGYVLATLQARRAVEIQLEASGAMAAYPPWTNQQLTAALRLDLADLGMSLRDHTDHDALPHLSKGGIWGALYVLTGSALGAHVIRLRAAALDMTSEFGARHLAAQTVDPTAWRRFLTALEHAALNPDDEADCVSASLATFERFERSYAQTLTLAP